MLGEDWKRKTSQLVKLGEDGYENRSQSLQLSQEASVEGAEHTDQCENYYSELLDPEKLLIEEASRKRIREEDIAWLARYGLTQGIIDHPFSEEMATGCEEQADGKKRKVDEEEQRQKLMEGEQSESLKMLLKLGFEGKEEMKDLKRNQIELGKSVTKVEQTVEANKKEQDDRIEKLEKLILEHRTVGAPPGLDNLSDAGSLGTDFSATVLARKSWRPQYIEVKGWVSNWKCPAARSSQMIMYADLQKILDNMTGTLKPEDRNMVCVDRTNRLNAGRTLFGSARLGFKQGMDSEAIWRIKKFLDVVVQPPAQRAGTPDPWWPSPIPTGDVLIANVQQEGLAPERFKFLVDAPPWKRPHIKAVSKFQGTAKGVFFPKEIPFKGEMGPPKSSILVTPPGAKPFLLAEWKGASWEIFEEQWELMKQTFKLADVSTDQFKTELSKS